MGTPINPGDLQFKTREYYLNGGTDYANNSTLSFQQLDTTLIFLSNSIANTSGTPIGPDQSIQFKSGSSFSGSNALKFNYTNNSVILTGSLIVSNSLNVIGTGSITGSLIVSNSFQTIGTGSITGSLIVSNSLNVIGTGSISGSAIISGSLVINPSPSIVGSNLNGSFLIGRASSGYTMQTTGSFALGTGGSGGGGNGGFSYDAASVPTFTLRNPGGDAGLNIKTNVSQPNVQAIIRPNVSSTSPGFALSANFSGTDSLSNHLTIVSSSHGRARIGIGTFTPSDSYSLTVSGSVSISNILTLTPQSPLPSGADTGSFAVSSSIPAKPYFWDGSTWQALY